MRKILIGLAVVVVVLILIAIVVPLLIPADAYRGRIVEAVQSATGRELRIEGPLSFSILPSIAIDANNVALANAPGTAPKDMMTLGKLQVGLKLFPLLGGDVEIDKFVLVDPVVHLAIDKSGRPNWDFSTTPPQAPPAAKPQAEAEVQSQAQSLRQLRLGEVELTNGTIDYSDARTGAHQEFSKIGLTVKLPSLDDPAAIDGSVDWRGKTVKLSVSAEKPRALMGSGSGALKAKVSSDPLTLSYDGTVTGGGPALQLAGAVDLDIPSLRDLATWAGNPLPAKQGGLGPFSVKGKLQGTTDNLAVSDVKITLDSIHGTGSLSVAAAGAKPTIKGQLDIDKLDLDPYLGGGSAKPTGATPPAPGAAQPQPENGWSTEPIDFSPLKAANLDFALGAGAIHYKKLDIGKSALRIRIQDGKLGADLSQLALYDGSGKGSVAVDAAGSVPTVEASFDLAGVQAGPLLSAAIDFSRLTGVGNLNFSLTSRGNSQRELIGALGGKGALAFKNGTIKGLDLLAMVKNVAQSFTAATGGSGETAFTDLAGTFTVANGIMKNEDLALKSPVLAASGSGTVDLPQRRIDYRVQPDVKVPGLNVAVPVLITGPWSNVSYQPDVKGILSQKLGKPGALLQGLKGGSPSGGAAGVLKGLFGGK
ncbi:MAG TPA: AsmA family protein [Alphaproteobacteria bacterium]|nr:AsmA family protein [Alphaproteobacteria bacterium]